MNPSPQRTGIIYALTAYFIWGIAPAYFKTIEAVPSGEILAHRVIWSFAFMVLLLSVFKHWANVRALLKQKKKLLMLMVTSTTIGINWLVFIWAVTHDHMLEASLGYFINPLFNVLFGMFFLGERFRFLQWCAVFLALGGVLLQLWQFGSLPVIALILATTFGIYGLLRKKISVDAQTGMLFETLWLLPIALGYLLFFADSTTSQVMNNTLSLNLLLASAGIVTTIPLLFFTAAATRLKLSTLGFFQYIGPTLIFVLATVVYGEPIGIDKLVTFGFIWVALLIFTLDGLYTQRKLR